MAAKLYVFMPSGGSRQNSGRKSDFSFEQKKFIAGYYALLVERHIFREKVIWAYSICNDLMVLELIDKVSNESYARKLLRWMIDPYHSYFFLNDEPLNIFENKEKEAVIMLAKLLIQKGEAIESFPRPEAYKQAIISAMYEKFETDYRTIVSRSQISKAIRDFPRDSFLISYIDLLDID